MAKTLLALALLVFTSSSFAVVDMKNSNFSDSWTDIKLPSSGYDLRIKRTYNSRSLFSGIFGFGWCSDYETKLEVTAESGIRVTECGGGMQISYTAKNHNPKAVKQTIKKIIAGIRKTNKSISSSELKKLEKELAYDQNLRIALEKRLDLNGKVKAGTTYRAIGRESETVVLKGNEYVRNLANGTFQKFNSKGLLTHMYDRNRNYIRISYKGDRILKVSDNNGRQLIFSYNSQKKLKSISGPNNIKVEYKFKGEDLTYAKNQWKDVFTYQYDDLHNLTKFTLPDNTYKAITYNKDRDWVTSFRNRKGCKEDYKYRVNKKAKFDHYWSEVTKTCKGKVTNKSSYEFVYRGSTDKTGAQYLHRVKSDINGDKTDITYHPVFGKPEKLIKNGLLTTYKYDDAGFMVGKKEPFRHFKYSYDNKCSKVSSVTTRYYGRFNKKKKRKPLKVSKASFSYEKPKCNLKRAKNSDGQIAYLKYDSKGRIAKITDQSKKTVKINYEERFGKPRTVQRPGLGSITVTYKTNGDIKKVDSKQGPRVAVQVANVFNNLLELISPATTDLSL